MAFKLMDPPPLQPQLLLCKTGTGGVTAPLERGLQAASLSERAEMK